MPTRLVAVLATIATLSAPGPADDKADREARIKELEKQIAESEGALAKLRAEYKSLIRPAAFTSVDDLLAKGHFQVGEQEPIRHVAKAYGVTAAAEEAVKKWNPMARPATIERLVLGGREKVTVVLVFADKPAVNEKSVPQRTWRSVGSELFDGVSYPVLEEVPAKK
jgi:hypothetical protein